jgi:hypothetical protein
MPQLTRIFDSSKNASAALAELQAKNFPDVRLATGPASNGNGADPIGSITSAGFSSQEAELYAGSLKNGSALLSVGVSFGRGRQAEQILDRHGPSEPVPSVDRVEPKKSSDRVAASDEDAKAAPFSTLLRLPVLTNSRPTTVTSLGDQRPTFPTGLLKPDFHVSKLFGLPLLTNPKARASLIDDPAPLSTWLGLPVLLRSPRRAVDVEPEQPLPE